MGQTPYAKTAKFRHNAWHTFKGCNSMWRQTLMTLEWNAERRLIVAGMGFVIIHTLFDVVEDWRNGDAWWMLLGDVTLQLTVLGLFIYWFCYNPWWQARRNRELERTIQRSHHDLVAWQEKAASLLQGLGKKIDEQFDCWSLSTAEKQVGLLMLKGLSNKECAEVRGVSEKTIRHQASSIYQKSGLPSRTALSAFFLEDLLLPDSGSASA